MKFNIPALFTGILLVGIFISCQRELSGDDVTPAPNNPSTDNGDYIDRIRYTDVLSGGLDSFTYVDQYQYDAQKRLVRISRDSMYLSPGNLSYTGTYTYTISFFYNGTDTLPYKKAVVLNVNSSADRSNDTTWFTYTGTRLLKDSTVSFYVNSSPPSSGTSTAVSHYSYAPGKIFISRPDPAFTDEVDTLQVDVFDNIVNSKTYDDIGNLQFETVVTYDGKVNPLRRYKPFHRYIIYGPEPDEDEMNGFNNYTSIKNYDRNTGVLLIDKSYTYQYNAQGYPVKQTTNGFTSPDKVQRLFYYKTL